MSLILAVPSKGRLQEQVLDYFSDAGLAMQQAQGARGYRARLSGMPDIDVRLLSASEIAQALIAGDVHLGITGEDLIRESTPAHEEVIALIKPLGFGHADVVVAVPQSWIDVSTMADLDDVCAAFFQRHKRRLRIATKFVSLTRGFFAQAGIWDYRIVESAGATEGAPAAGTADAIVDITTTGATLAANNLKMLEDGTILRSQAQLAASLTALWSDAARKAARTLITRLTARERARAALVLRVRLTAGLDHAIAELGALGATVLSRPSADNAAGEYAILCPRAAIMTAIEVLRAEGCGEPVTVHDADYVFVQDEPLLAVFDRAVAG
jgi:ATP phosphoribosyltransferase